MNLVFKSSFDRDLAKIRNKTVLAHLKELILNLEGIATLAKVSKLEKISGHSGYYRIRLGDYRLGLHRPDGKTVTLIRFLHRKDVYRYFP